MITFSSQHGQLYQHGKSSKQRRGSATEKNAVRAFNRISKNSNDLAKVVDALSAAGCAIPMYRSGVVDPVALIMNIIKSDIFMDIILS
jgi:hypothetical protein